MSLPVPLTPEQEALVEREQLFRAQARTLALELGLDEGDVLHQLKQLQRTPIERLRRGLAHGRSRGRLLKRG